MLNTIFLFPLFNVHSLPEEQMLNKILVNDKLKALITQMQSLPSLPSLYNEILEKLQSPDVSIKEVSETISQDISMSARIVQISNTTLYGTRSVLP